VTVELDGLEAVAARGRQAAIGEELWKAELVRDRVESLQHLVTPTRKVTIRALLENLHLDRALRAVEENVGALWDALLDPHGT
jgi:hypothetical protein